MPLPTYQQSGLLSQPTQRLDFASERESERTSQMMAQQLDRLSEFAFKAAAKEAVREGEIWAYKNPITPAQLDRASKGIEDLAASLPKAGTFFGDSARKIQAGQLRADLELAARSEIADISKAVEAGQITNMAQLDDRFYGISKGYGKFIAKIDPEQANQFSASVATAANPVYQSAAKKIGELASKAKQEQTNEALSYTDMILRNNIEIETDIVKLDKMNSIERKRILDNAALTNDPTFFAAKQKELDTLQERAFVDVISKYVQSDEFSLATGAVSLANKFKKLEEGNAGKYQGVWTKLPTETRKKIVDQFYDSESKRAKLVNDDVQIQEKLGKTEAFQTLDDFYQGKKTADETINVLIRTGQANPSILKSIRSGEEQPTNPNMFFYVEGQIDKGIVSKDDIEKLYNDGKLNLKDAIGFRKQIETQSKELGEAKQIIKAKLKLPDGLFVGNEYKKQQEKYSELVGELIFASNDARQAGKPFNAISFARQLAEKESGKLVTESVKKLEKDLTDAWGRANVRQPAKKDFTDDELKILYPKMKEKDRKRIIDRQKDLEDAK
jgi:hypothetical protein